MAGRDAEGRLTDQTYWDQVWTQKDRRDWGDLRWVDAYFQNRVLDRVLRARLGNAPGRRFLELGCGTGKWLIYFHKRFGYGVTGCDYSETSCLMAQRNMAAAGVEGTVIPGDLFALTGEYDVVFSTGLVEHFEDPHRVLAKFVSLLRPGGTLITLVPNLVGLSGLYHRLWKQETFSTHRPITLAELRRWYADLGLRQVEARALGSVVPTRFPRDSIRRRHPRLYRPLWTGFLHPLTWATNRGCIWAFEHGGIRLESERFSPELYAIASRP